MARQINEELYQYITDTCLESYDAPSSPLQLLEKIWKNPDFPMHCPEHHYLVPAVLLTTYCRLKNDGKAKLREELNLAGDRAKNLLAGFCGWYGACGAAVGSGMFLSVVTGTSPYSTDTWALVNRLSSDCLYNIAEIGGPRCCKRVCFTAVSTSITFMKQHFDLDLGQTTPIRCTYHQRNAECKKTACPYYPAT